MRVRKCVRYHLVSSIVDMEEDDTRVATSICEVEESYSETRIEILPCVEYVNAEISKQRTGKNNNVRHKRSLDNVDM